MRSFQNARALITGTKTLTEDARSGIMYQEQKNGTMCKRHIKIMLHTIIVTTRSCDSRYRLKYCVRTSVHLEVNVLDDFAAHCVLDSSGVFGAVLLELGGHAFLAAPGVIVAVALKALDCQACDTNQNRM
jgi:hypothetical protein